VQETQLPTQTLKKEPPATTGNSDLLDMDMDTPGGKMDALGGKNNGNLLDMETHFGSPSMQGI